MYQMLCAGKKEVETLLQDRPLLFDGSMGTYLSSSVPEFLPKCELANLFQPDRIRAIHREYLEAGAKAIKTNSFGANPYSLEGSWELTEQVIVQSWELACQAAEGTDSLIFADIGPLPPIPEHLSPLPDYQKIADLFLKAGARCFLLETFSNGEALIPLASYLKSKAPDSFLITSFAVSPDGYTREGISGLSLLQEMASAAEIDAIGLNCVSGPYHLLQLIKKWKPLLGSKPLSVMPNAGYPTVVGGRTFFQNSPAYYAEQMLQLREQGVSILGGCCGTDPAFIHYTAKALQESRSPSSPSAIPAKPEKSPPHSSPQINRFAQKLQRGQRVIAVELDPPLDADAGFFLEGARKLQRAGADILTIADCPIARPRADSSILAGKIRQELDMDTLPHMTCRDRNLNATKALLLGLQIQGVYNILTVTGDPIPSAERDEVKSVFHFHSRMLAKYISSLNQEIFSTPFTICGALNVNARNFEAELRTAALKQENGVSVFLTQPVLTEQAVRNLKQARSVLKAKLLGGILPLVSYRNACFLENEITGISIDSEIISRYKGLDREEASQLAVQISVHIAQTIAPYTDGYYLMTPFKRVELICEILKNLLENS